jgi:hypothetical protein
MVGQALRALRENAPLVEGREGERVKILPDVVAGGGA